MKRKWLSVGIILLFVGTCIVPFISFCSAESDDYYFEDVYVVITGRCRSIFTTGEWKGGLLIGNQKYSGITANGSLLERININIYHQLNSGPCLSLKQSKNTTVNLIDTNGIFFWGCRKYISWRLIPPVIFVLCNVEEVNIHQSN